MYQIEGRKTFHLFVFLMTMILKLLSVIETKNWSRHQAHVTPNPYHDPAR